jgi:hypothetical protein
VITRSARVHPACRAQARLWSAARRGGPHSRAPAAPFIRLAELSHRLPWGRGWTAPGVFFSGAGLRTAKGYGRSGRTACYGPQAGERGLAKLLAVSNNVRHDTKAGSQVQVQLSV